MEGMMERSSRKGTDLLNDKDLRMKRPANSQGTGKLGEDLGSSGFVTKSSKRADIPPKSRSASSQAKERVIRDKKEVIDLDADEEDDDEIDFLSEPPSDAGDKASIERPPKKSSGSALVDKHQNNSDVLKSLKFKKNKSENDNAISTSSKPRDTSSTVLEPKSPNLSGTSRLPSRPRAKPKPCSKPSTVSSSRISSQSATTRPIRRKASATASTSTVTSNRPRANKLPSSSSDSSSDEEPKLVWSSKGKQKELGSAARPLSLLSPSPAPAPFPLALSPSEKTARKPVSKSKPFPMNNSPSPAPAASAAPSAFPVMPSPGITPKKLDDVRRVKSKAKLTAAAFPVSPMGSQELVTNSEVNGRSRAAKAGRKAKTLRALADSDGDDRDSDDDDVHETMRKAKKKKKLDKGLPQAQPFPISVDSPMATPTAGPSKRPIGTGKRTSSSSPEDSPLKKRRRAEDLPPSSPPEGIDNDDDLENDFFYNPSVDANTLCPYCDEPLPPHPTPHLQHLLQATFHKSSRAPRPTNPMGRKAAVGVFINVCQRHRFESEILPEAEQKGWPKEIDWEGLTGRVLRMKHDLEDLVENRETVAGAESEDGDENNDEWDVPGQNRERNKQKQMEKQTAPRRARDRCVFWTDVMKEVREKGTRVAANVKSQFANFEKTQPGYYGELGSLLIHQSLYELFPPEIMRPDLVAPLNPKEFIDRVLLPEVAMRLIMEDKALSGPRGSLKALSILRESTTYGVAMFPEDTGEQGEGKKKSKGKKNKGKRKAEDGEEEEEEDGKSVSVVDNMVKEKARRRRLELEKEEEEEEERTRRDVRRREREERKAEMQQGKWKEREEDLGGTVGASERARPRPKPIAVQKSASSASLSAMEVDPEPDTAMETFNHIDDMDDEDCNPTMAQKMAKLDDLKAMFAADDEQKQRAKARKTRTDTYTASLPNTTSSRQPRKPNPRSRSPSLELIEQPPPSSSWGATNDADVTPKAKHNSMSSSSSRNPEADLPPLDVAKRRRREQERKEREMLSSPPEPSIPKRTASSSKSTSRFPMSGLGSDVDGSSSEDGAGRATRKRKAAKAATAKIQRTETQGSDSKWLLSEDDE